MLKVLNFLLISLEEWNKSCFEIVKDGMVSYGIVEFGILFSWLDIELHMKISELISQSLS